MTSSSNMTNATEPRPRFGLSVLSLMIGLAALAAFIFLNRMMAPPFPNFGVSPTAGLSNAIVQAKMKSATNASSSTNTSPPPPANR